MQLPLDIMKERQMLKDVLGDIQSAPCTDGMEDAIDNLKTLIANIEYRIASEMGR
jgi:hypothetical protein